MTASLQFKHGAALPSLREGRAPVRDRLMAMLFLTALLHAIVILGLTFTASSRANLTDTPQLDVLLVTNEVPQAQSNDQAAYLAQRTQHGSGNTDTSAAASPSSQGGVEVRADNGEGSINEHGERTQDTPMLTSDAPSSSIRLVGPDDSAAGVPALPQFIGDTPGEPRSGRGDAVQLMLRGKSNGERWITPDTQASQLAPYLASWKRKVERVGTLNFPMAAQNARLSGSPVVEVEISADGHLRQAKVQRSSGHGALDEAALTILRLASPFEPFPPDLAAGYARLRFAYQWDFEAGTLQSGAVTSSSDTPSRP